MPLVNDLKGLLLKDKKGILAKDPKALLLKDQKISQVPGRFPTKGSKRSFTEVLKNFLLNDPEGVLLKN